MASVWKFQSTLPAWGATPIGALTSQLCAFQSTLPAWGATWRFSVLAPDNKFQSTLPAWGATEAHFFQYISTGFQSTLPAWGATARSVRRRFNDNFNPRSPRGERQLAVLDVSALDRISIHAPRVGSD